MARNREALVLLLDVGPSMHGILSDVQKLCSMLIEKKLIYNRYDEVGLVLFGTQETNNELSRDIGGYNHVSVLKDIKVVDGDVVEVVQSLPRGTVPGDFLDAIIVGMDMLIKKYGPSMKGKKRLCLMTNAIYPTKDPYEGTKEDQARTIAKKMSAEGIKLKSIVLRGGLLTEDFDESTIDENDSLLNVFSSNVCNKKYVENSLSLLGALKTRRVAPVTVFRGDLEMSPTLKIKVWVYKQTSEEKLPTLRKYSDKAPPTDKFAKHEAKVDYEYRKMGDSSDVIAPQDRIKGFHYGPQIVPVSSAQIEAVKFQPEKGIKFLGFTEATNIYRHYYMKDVYIFFPEPGKEKDVLALSSIAKAMKQENKVAILRCVWRNGQGNVIVGLLSPNTSERTDTLDSFYFNVLPFADDVREFQFPSFSSFPASCQPNEQQQATSDSLVKMLDLAPSGKEEILKPDFTPNPVLQRFYSYLELKSNCLVATIPPVDETLKKITESDPEFVSENHAVIDLFHQTLELRENPKLRKLSRRSLREKPSVSVEQDGSIDLKAQVSKSLVEKIGDSTPVEDFEALISRRDNPAWVEEAIMEMKAKILKLLENSDAESNVFPCLVALRKSCITEQEPKQFNDFLRQLHRICHEKNLIHFLEHLSSRQITLIPKCEAADSDATDEEAKNFPGNRLQELGQ